MMCLFLLLMAALLALGVGWDRWENRRAVRLAESAYRDRNQFVTRVVDLKGASTQNLAEDYTYWDEMVRFVQKPDKKWASQNLDQSLSTYKVTASWVFDLTGRLVYAAKPDPPAKTPKLPFEAAALVALFRADRLRHFYLQTPDGILEIRGATIHKTADPKRNGRWYGYFLVGRLWDSEYLKELSGLTGCRVELARDSRPPRPGARPDGSYLCSLSLPGPRGDSTSTALFVGTLDSIRLFSESTRSGFVLFVVFVLLVGGALLTSLHRRVSRPLACLSASLETGDTAALGGLKTSPTELGELARLIDSFFRQKSVLVEEVAERVHAESALMEAQRDLERRVRERTSELEAAYIALQSEYEERKLAESELSRAEAQLIQSAKLAALGTLCAGVAHELNQPVAVIRGTAQQMLSDPAIDVETEADLKLIEGQTSRMMKIVNHLRTFSRATRGEVERVDLNHVIRNCFVIVGQQLKAHGVDVDLQLADTPLWVTGDANELEQVVLNLINNARDAMEGRRDGCITIRSWEAANGVTMEFRDNGVGLSEAVASRLFDPFFTTKEPGKGTGLGLSISHTIVQKHGGTIRAHNDGGAVFVMELPSEGSAEIPFSAENDRAA